MHIVMASGIAPIIHIIDLHAMSGPVMHVIAGNLAHAKQPLNIATRDMKAVTRINIVNQAANMKLVILVRAIATIVLANKYKYFLESGSSVGL